MTSMTTTPNNNSNNTATGGSNPIQHQVINNFNPSWMQQKIPTSRPIPSNQQKLTTENDENNKTCDPIFAKHSYGREDLLAMMGKETMKAPSGLDKCPFYIEGKPQTPMVLLPFTEPELRLQQNINSSKAVSAYNRAQGGGHPVHSDSVDLAPTSGGGGSITAGPSRSGQGSSSTYTTNKRYQSQQGGGDIKSQQPVPSRWMALTNSSGNSGAISSGGPPQRQQSWKNGQQNNGNGGGIFERTASYREKTTSFTSNQLEDNSKKPPPEVPQTEQPLQKESHDIKSSKDEQGIEPNRIADSGQKEVTQQAVEQYPNQSSNSFNSTEGAGGTQQTSDSSNQQRLPQAEPPIQISQTSQPAQQQQPEKWNYLDPSGLQRGPFDSQQMQAWFSSGYFTASLQVCRVGDSNYISLGELFHVNGEQTPFISKIPVQAPPPPPIVRNQPPPQPLIAGQQSQQRISPSELLNAAAKGVGTGTLGLADVERIWATTPLEDVVNTSQAAVTAPPPIPFSNTNANIGGIPTMPPLSSTAGFAHTAFSQHLKEFELEKVLQAKEVQIMEEQRKLREKEDLLRRRDEQERMEKERRMQEMENELKRKQEELDRIAREKDQEFEQRCLQMAEYERKKKDELLQLEQRILTEQQLHQKRMKEEDQRRKDELQKALFLEQERQRQLMEAEAKRKRDEDEARLRLSMQEAQHMKELAQEKAKRAEEEQRRRLIEEQQRRQQQALEEARAERIQQQRVAAKAEAVAKAEQQRMSSNSNTWQPVPQQAAPPQTPTQQQQFASGWTTIQQPPARPAWQPVPIPSKPIEINYPPSPPLEKQSATAAAAAAEKERRGWQQVSRPKPAPIPPVVSKNVGVIGNGGGTKQQNKQQKVNNKAQQQQAKQQTQTQVEDKFTAWIIKRVKELNASVDAEVFANFIAQIDSPNEAEDYIVGYLGDRKEIKDFHREFLNKRIELRPRVQQARKDDLSRPAAALSADADLTSAHTKPSGYATTSGGSGNNTGGNGAAKKKKPKQQKVLASTLGFRSAPDPNRVNIGEIDSVPIVLSGANKKR